MYGGAPERPYREHALDKRPPPGFQRINPVDRPAGRSTTKNRREGSQPLLDPLKIHAILKRAAEMRDGANFGGNRWIEAAQAKNAASQSPPRHSL